MFVLIIVAVAPEVSPETIAVPGEPDVVTISEISLSVAAPTKCC